jgi:phage tail-like protein
MLNDSVLFPGQNFLITCENSAGVQTPLGGFEQASLPLKVKGMYKVTDITLKRGVVGSANLANWIEAARSAGTAGKRTAVLTQRDATGRPVISWRLSDASPKKYTGPTLGGKGSDVAIEELILSPESIELIPSK